MFDTRASFDAVLDCLCRVLACCPVVASARSVLTKAWRVISRYQRPASSPSTIQRSVYTASPAPEGWPRLFAERNFAPSS